MSTKSIIKSQHAGKSKRTEEQEQFQRAKPKLYNAVMTNIEGSYGMHACFWEREKITQ